MTTTPTARMRAISQHAWGAADVLHEVQLERPQPLPTEVLVRVHAAGVNPTDWKSRSHGGLGLWGKPPILGYDVSGVVEATGAGVTLFAPGDEVFGMPRFPHQAGAYAEYLTAPSRHLARKPPSLNHVEAAALPLVGLTAWQALVDTAVVRPGQRVLIHAAAGGVGHLAVQIAKARGAYVIGSASPAKHDVVRKLGADEVIDYRAVDFLDAVHDIDVVIDPVGGDYVERSLATLREGGILVTLPAPLPDALVASAASRSLRAMYLLVEPDRDGLAAIAELVAAGRLRPLIDRVFPLAEAAAAHAYGEQGRTTGKIVLSVV
jgi:NADPH:quinone reductase-like Zn-dependent oxidoreductase